MALCKPFTQLFLLLNHIVLCGSAIACSFVWSPMDVCAMNRTSALSRLWLVNMSPLHNIFVQVFWCSRVFTCNTGSQICECFLCSASLHELGLAGECTLCPSVVYGNAHGFHLCFPSNKGHGIPYHRTIRHPVFSEEVSIEIFNIVIRLIFF